MTAVPVRPTPRSARAIRSLAMPAFWLLAALLIICGGAAVRLATAFAWGAAVATTVSIPGNQAIYSLLSKLVSPEFAAAWGSAIAGPTVEELLKGLGVIVIVLIARHRSTASWTAWSTALWSGSASR